MKYFFVIGDQASHSLSPLIFNHWFKKYNIKAKYSFLEVTKKNFDSEMVNCCIEVGYLSKNTYENALETRYWALEKKIQSILLITSNLHMQRAEFLFNQLSGLEVIPYAVSNEESIIPFEKMIEEYVKLLISKIVFVKKYEI